MWRAHLCNLLISALHKAARTGGSTAVGIICGIGVIIAGFIITTLIEWYRAKNTKRFLDIALKSWPPSLGSLLALLLFGGAIYSWAISAVIYQDHMHLVETNGSLVRENKLLKMAETRPSDKVNAVQPHTGVGSPVRRKPLGISQHGNSNRQTVLQTHGPITQTSNGDCSPNVIGGNADLAGCTAPNPYKPTVTYAPDGTRTTILGTQTKVYAPMVNQVDTIHGMERKRDWSGLLAWSEKTRKAEPGWFTPDFISGRSRLYLCQKAQARADLNKFVAETKDAVAYSSLRGTAQSYLLRIATPVYEHYCAQLSK